MQDSIHGILEAIEASASFAEVRARACLPEPDGDSGYLFVSYSHADYKAVMKRSLVLPILLFSSISFH